MCQAADSNSITLGEFSQKLRSKVEALPEGATRSRYSRALSLFLSWLQAGLPEESQTEDPVSRIPEWLISLRIAAVPLKTALLYLDIISSLYHSCAKDGAWQSTKLFSNLKTLLKTDGDAIWNKGIDDEIFNRALDLTKGASGLEGDISVAADILLYSLIHGCMPLMEVAMLTRADVAPDEESRAIAARQLKKSNRKYVFPLRQSSSTPRQVSLRVQRLLSDLFRSRRLPVSDNAADTIESLWAYAALSLNTPPSLILSHLGKIPPALPILHLLPESRSPIQNSKFKIQNFSSPSRSPIQNSKFKIQNSRIAELFLSNPPAWYAMSLRPGVKYPSLDLRLRQNKSSLPPLSIFYPCEEIARTIKKKVIFKSRPILPKIVFFRTRATDIVRIFSRIGDIAWCYTTTGRPGAPYARIARWQFERFQQTVASFTPDFEVAESGALPLRENDRVKVIGGLFSGKEGEFETVAQEDANTVYRIRLIGDNGIDWRVSLDPRLVQPDP